MRITGIELKRFRCFEETKLALNGQFILVEGDNGSGKSSLLEALHYLCYLRSFRTYNPRHLIKQGEESFFAKVTFKESGLFDSIAHELQVGFATKKRSVRLDGRPIASYKELMGHYRIITLSEYDLELINGAPETRRNFMDQAIVLAVPEYSRTITESRKLVEHRNSLLQRGTGNLDLYRLWTQQLWEKTVAMQEARRSLLAQLQETTNKLLAEYFPEIAPVSLSYRPRRDVAAATFDDFWAKNETLYAQEREYGYSLVGPHLDDYSISWQGSSSKLYASRGQQKLLVFLLKLAQAQQLCVQKGPLVILIDDFLTDFDKKRATTCLALLSQLSGQCILTSPFEAGFLAATIVAMGGSRIRLTE